MSTYTSQQDTLFADYTRTTNRWGRITLLIGLVIATSVPVILLLTNDLDVTSTQILTAFVAAAGAYGVFWVVEPITYYPILGPAGMYQAFLIGNIANKLVPSAIVAQSTIKAEPGTRKASYAATAAISGAAMVHVVSLLLLVGILGTWVVSITPEAITATAQSYILPSILGAVMVQLIVTLQQFRATIIALAVSLIVILLIVPNTPERVGQFSIAICVIATVLITWFTRNIGKNDADGGQASSEKEGGLIN